MHKPIRRRIMTNRQKNVHLMGEILCYVMLQFDICPGYTVHTTVSMPPMWYSLKIVDPFVGIKLLFASALNLTESHENE